MLNRPPTFAEKQFLGLCIQIPCIVCSTFHGVNDSPAEIHHTRGCRIKGCHFLVLSLCARHHRIKDNDSPKRWVSRHGDGKRAFEGRYAPEKELLVIQAEKINVVKAACVATM